MKSKAIVLMVFLPAIAASFVTQKSSARQSERTKDSTTVAPAFSVRERFVGTRGTCVHRISLHGWDAAAVSRRRAARKGLSDVRAGRPHVRAAHESGPAGVERGGGIRRTRRRFLPSTDFMRIAENMKVDEAKHVMIHLPEVTSWPGFVGSKQPRPYTFSDSRDLLAFSGKERDEPGAESYSITWRKVGSAPRPSP